MSRPLILLTLGAIVALGCSGGTAGAQAPVAVPGTVRLPGHIPGNVRTASVLGRLPSTQVLHLALVLPQRSPDEMAALLKHLYTPGDPLYGHYLSPAETTARFGPTQADYDAVRTFAEAHGLVVTHTYPNRALLDVSGSAAAVEAAFGLRLQSYRGADGRAFFAPDQNPAIPTALQGRLSGVVGLDNAGLIRPASLRRKADTALPGVSPILTPSGSPGISGLGPSDIMTAYNLNGVPANGTGQVLGLLELDRYSGSDIATYESQYGLPNVTLQNISIDGYTTTGPPDTEIGGAEVTLDIELQIAVAPGMSRLEVYEAANSGNSFVDICNQIASDNTAKEISISWGGPEPSTAQSYTDAENAAFQKMALQGQSIFAAAGDNGAYDDGSSLGVDDPASQPYMTGVGGTTLSLNGDGSYASETTWSGGGGGISGLWPIQPYQTGFVSAASKGSTTKRNVPDVSLNADPNTGYSVYYTDPVNGAGYYGYGGTSCAAPLWAAFTAVVNQQRVTNGLPAVGFSNPALYALAGGPDYALAFHDIADNSTNGFYPAVTGYDDATGLGTFNGANLFSFLTGLYAKESFSGTQLGTLPNPYATITNANTAAPSTPVNLYIEGGTYGENLTISKPITLINYGNGSVVIGT